MSWGYGQTGEPGPDLWYRDWPLANTGTRQSPVDIVTSQTSPLPSSPISISYSPARDLKITNTGAGWQVRLESCQSLVSVGGERYRVVQCHAHWGGSEHAVDGVRHAAEVHLVHYNTKYQTFSRALHQSDGLLVLGVLVTQVQEGDQGVSQELDKICQHLREIKLRDSTTTIREELHLERLLPADRSYFTYLGSLTTPPLLESVTWVLFRQPLKATKKQVSQSGLRSVMILTQRCS